MQDIRFSINFFNVLQNFEHNINIQVFKKYKNIIIIINIYYINKYNKFIN